MVFVVLGFLDAFVSAHHKHRLDSENSVNFRDCMKGGIRFMTPAYAHAYQATCLTRHMPAVPRQNFRPPMLKARDPYLPNDLSTTCERGNDFRGCAVYTDGGTRVVDGETLAGWGVISRSLRGRIFVLFCPCGVFNVVLRFWASLTLLSMPSKTPSRLREFRKLW